MMSQQQLTTIDRACKQVADETGEDYKLVHDTVMFQFNQITRTMKDPTNTNDILLNQLFKFKLKTRYKNNKTLKYCAHDSNNDKLLEKNNGQS